MRRFLAVLLLAACAAAPAQAHGLLIPTEQKVPPLAMVNHQVDIAIDDQVAITRVEQTFRNHTDRPLEATYIFPVPKGASVRKFAMWIDGKEVPGELVEAAKARQIYTDIVQRTLDPGLLEYIGGNLLRLKVFPVPAKGDQKVSLSFTSVAARDNDLVEYTYPLKTDGVATATLEKFSLNLRLQSQRRLQSIYSPTHAITVTRLDDHTATIAFAEKQALLDRNFQLFYTTGGKDVGLTTLMHRPIAGQDGYALLLISPRAELSKQQRVPRDMVFVLDTSGSMRGKRIEQARSALKFCLNNLQPGDRFGLMNFATTVNRYADDLLAVEKPELERANRWVDRLEAVGATAISAALDSALDMRPKDPTRTFTIVFFTDGQPTSGETKTEAILRNVASRNTASTRLFTFGVGDDVNATLLDALAAQSRGVSTYVRESEDIEAKVSGLYAKISNPILTNLKLTVSGEVKLSEVYPPQLPDLFHGSQLVVLARYSGHGLSAIKLTGNVGKDSQPFVYETTFPEKTTEAKSFVEDLWARRKVGYLLGEIRRNGANKELVETVVTLAKRYGITTPYTSYLIVPDAPLPVAGAAVYKPDTKPDVSFHLNPASQGLRGNMPKAAPSSSAKPVPGQLNTSTMQGGSQAGAQLGAFGGIGGQLVGGQIVGGQQVGQLIGQFGGQFGGQMMGGQLFGQTGRPFQGQIGGPLVSGQIGGQIGGQLLGGQFGAQFGGIGGLGGQLAGGTGSAGDRGINLPAQVKPVGSTTTATSNKEPSVKDFVDQVQTKPGDGANARLFFAQEVFNNLATYQSNDEALKGVLAQGQVRWGVNGQAYSALANGGKEAVQSGKLGVELSLDGNQLRQQERLLPTALRRVQGRTCMEVSGVWLDEGYDPKMKSVTVKAMSPAYFRILERHPEVLDMYRLGNAVVWVTPSNQALIVDASMGREQLPDEEIDAFFVATK